MIAGVLTADEAIAYLRLDTMGLRDPRGALDRYRKLGRLRGTQVGRCVMYLRSELDKFLERQTVAVPR